MGFIVTAVAAAVGVFLSSLVKVLIDHFLTGASLKNANRDDDLQTIIESAENVRARAVHYWSVADVDKHTFPDAATMAALLLFIGKVIDELFESDEALKQAVQTELNRFDDSVSRGQFMVKNRAAQTDRLVEIEDNAFSLIYTTRRCRRKLSRPVFGS